MTAHCQTGPRAPQGSTVAKSLRLSSHVSVPLRSHSAGGYGSLKLLDDAESIPILCATRAKEEQSTKIKHSMQCFWLYGRVSLKCHNINYSTERSIDRSVAISLSKLPQRHFFKY